MPARVPPRIRGPRSLSPGAGPPPPHGQSPHFPLHMEGDEPTQRRGLRSDSTGQWGVTVVNIWPVRGAGQCNKTGAPRRAVLPGRLTPVGRVIYGLLDWLPIPALTTVQSPARAPVHSLSPVRSLQPCSVLGSLTLCIALYLLLPLFICAQVFFRFYLSIYRSL